MLIISILGLTSIGIVKADSFIYVYPNQHIQDALNNSTSGQTIYIYKGIYNESLVITQDNLTIIGEDKYSTIINANGSEYALYIAYHGNNTISNLTFTNASVNGIYLYSESINHSWLTPNNTIRNCIISNNIENGIYINPTGYGCRIHDTRILDCRITHNGNGIYFHPSGNHCSIGYSNAHNPISNCTIDNNSGDGIRIYADYHHSFVSHVYVENCSISDNGYGIEVVEVLDGWNGNHSISNNRFLDNSHNAYDFYNSSLNVWYKNYWSDYTSMDSNRDDIGDTPYTIGNNKDFHPKGHLTYPRRNNPPPVIPPKPITNVTIHLPPSDLESFQLYYLNEMSVFGYMRWYYTNHQ